MILQSKLIVYIISAVLVVILASIIVKYIGKKIRISKSKSELKEAAEMAEASGEKMTRLLSDMTLNSYAYELFEAMDGIGTDEDAVFSTLRKLAENGSLMDLLKLQSIYVERFDMTLNQDLISELSADERKKAHDILAAKFSAKYII